MMGVSGGIALKGWPGYFSLVACGRWLWHGSVAPSLLELLLENEKHLIQYRTDAFVAIKLVGMARV